MRFWLGTHETSWLGRTDVPLFLSARRLRMRRTLPKALGPWALDSGGFSELSLYGRWQTTPRQYAAEVQWWRDRVGGMEWAAIQDWMCEPFMVAKTGLSVAEHQRRTIASYFDLRRLAPDLPWVPVLQGWESDDYLSHAEQYRAAGVDLKALRLVGMGSVCRRQGTAEATRIVRTLFQAGYRLHGFGFKLTGLKKCAPMLASSDSLAWSFGARRSPPLPGCRHKRCANCLPFALAWRDKVLRIVARAGRYVQLTMF